MNGKNSNPIPEPYRDPSLITWQSVLNQIELFKLQRSLLEKLFGLSWFQNPKNRVHPAYKKWSLLTRIIQLGTIKPKFMENRLIELGLITLETGVFATISEGSLSQIKLGNINLYGNGEVQKKILNNIKDSDKFDDLMVELYVSAHHKMEKHVVIPYEKGNFPDLEVRFNGNLLFYECKNLKTDNKNRIKKIVTKASNQLKNRPKESFGVLILDVSSVVGFHRVENDNLSSSLMQIIQVVKSALSGNKNRSVQVAVIVWNDFMRHGNPPERTLFTYRRRVEYVYHSSLKTSFIESSFLFKGYTVTNWVSWKKGNPLVPHITSWFNSNLGRDLMKIANISPQQIGNWYYEADDTSSVGPYLIIKKIIDEEKVALLIFDTQNNKTKLMGIYLIYSSFTETDIFLSTPIKLHSEFFQKFGRLVDTPFGNVTHYVDFEKKIFFQSIDIGKYRRAIQKRLKKSNKS